MLEAELATLKRNWPHDVEGILISQGNVAACCDVLGRHEETLRLCRGVYHGYMALYGRRAEFAKAKP